MRRASTTWISILASAALSTSGSMWGQLDRTLVGKPLPQTPFMFPVDAVHLGDEVAVVFSPDDVPAGTAVDLYLTEDRSMEEWIENPQLVDVRDSGAQTWLAGTALANNAVAVSGIENLSVMSGSRPGRGYDVVLDVNQNGQLDPGDLVDGRSGAALHVLGNWGDSGPHDVAVFEHAVSFWETMRIHHPSDWSEGMMVPLVVVSHGWTHDYTYYDDLASYMASYGYVVMSHRNEVGNGGANATTTASQTALQNIDALFNEVETMGGGVLQGHVDSHRIIHAGHSTGGECVVRAHVRLTEGDYVSPFVQASDFVLLQGLAPVAFLESDLASPMNTPYHQFFPAADTDVTGNASDGYVQGMAIFERGMGAKYATFIHGSGHNDLHDNPGSSLASGPDLIGKEATHDVMKPLFLALAEWHAWNNPAGLDYFQRNRQEFRPLCVGDSVVLSGEMRGNPEWLSVLDDFETSPDLGLASSGVPVAFDNIILHEVVMSDTDESFEFTGENWSNGMCRSRTNDEPRCATLAWEDDGDWCLEFPEPASWTEAESFRFRVASLTRHPWNEDGELHFEVSFEDASGQTATFPSSWWGGVIPPYPRSGGGVYAACLPSGAYTLTVGGSTWPEEQLVTIPGLLTEVGVGSTSFLWDAEGDCDTLQVLCYDTYGDGWDSGTFTLENAQGEVVLSGTLEGGFEPDLGAGWQNEFHTVTLPLGLVNLLNPQLDLNHLARACIQVGPSHGSPHGALALDDVHVTSPLGFPSQIQRPQARASIRMVPNPASDFVRLAVEGQSRLGAVTVWSLHGEMVWSCMSAEAEVVVDTRTWPSGMYFVVVDQAGEPSTFKLVVHR